MESPEGDYGPPSDMEPPWPESIPDREVRPALLGLLGVSPPPETVPFSTESEELRDGLVTRRLSFPNALGEKVPAVLVARSEAGERTLPGVVCSPGTSGDAELLTEESLRRDAPGTGPLRGWARALARRGFATLSLTLHLNDARRGSEARLHQRAKLLAPYGVTQMGLLVDEVLRGARVLSAHPAVDPARIALTGMSLGGNASWYSFACAPWIRAAAPVCGGLGSLRRSIRQGDPRRHGAYFYVPHLLRYFDHPTVVRACIAPRPLLVIAPREDEDMPAGGVDDLLREVAPAYARANAAECFVVHRPEGRHEYTREYFELVADWLGRRL